MKKWLVGIIVVIVVVILVIWIAAGHKAPPKTVTVTQGDIKETVTASGDIVPLHAIQVKSQIPGSVGQILVKEGQAVKKGDTLLVVKPNPTPSDVAQTVSTFKAAKAKFFDSRAKYQRDLKLSDTHQHFISNQDLEDAFQAMNQDKAAYQLAQQNLELLKTGQTNIDGKQIKNAILSPMGGSVLKINVDQGDSIVPVTPYQPGTALITMANMQDLVFKGEVSQTDVGKLRMMMPADLTIAALPKLKLKGKLTLVALQSMTQTSSQQALSTQKPLFEAPADLQNGFAIQISGFKLPKDSIIRAGYQTTAAIVVKEVKNALSIDQKALHFNGDQAYVYVPGAKKKPIKQNIKLGISDSLHSQVLSGLKKGEKVLLITPETKS